MASATFRCWRGAWVVDISTRIAGKRQRAIKTLGPSAKAKASRRWRDSRTWETIDSAEPEEVVLSYCFSGSPGCIRGTS
jgi:hypothetical protein